MFRILDNGSVLEADAARHSRLTEHAIDSDAGCGSLAAEALSAPSVVPTSSAVAAPSLVALQVFVSAGGLG
jgi:hypothetical protein